MKGFEFEKSSWSDSIENCNWDFESTFDYEIQSW